MHEARSGSFRKRTTLVVVMTAGALAAVLAATASARPEAKTISVAIVANPQMQDIASLTPKLFTAKSGIKVNYSNSPWAQYRETMITKFVGKAPIDTPRRAIGFLLGNAVRFGVADDVLAAGEGIETMLSLRCVVPTLPIVSALSANHLSATLLPLGLRRLYIARDADAAGESVQAVLTQRAETAGIETITLSPRLGDFNEDLHVFGLDALRAAVRIQLAPEDVARFLLSSTAVV